MLTRRSFCLAAAVAPLPASAQSGSDARFAAWLRGVQAEAVKAGVDPGTAEQALGSAQLLPEIMELARNQPEFKMSWPEYQNLVVSAERVKNGRALLGQNRALIDRFAAPVGLPSSMVVALWGIESNYGTRLGDFEVVPALATLAYNNFRASFFRQQLIAALKILSRGHVGLHQMKGSWAGAMGQCQFIPTSFLAYAVDGDGDGRADIWSNKADVFASISNYLRSRGMARWGIVGQGGHAGIARRVRRTHRAAGGRQRPGLRDDRELPRHSPMEPVGFLRARRRSSLRPRCILTRYSS